MRLREFMRDSRSRAILLVILTSLVAVSVALASQWSPVPAGRPLRAAALVVLIPANGTDLNFSLPLPVGLSASTVVYWSHYPASTELLVGDLDAPRNVTAAFQGIVDKYVPWDGSGSPALVFSRESGGVLAVHSKAIVAIAIEWTSRWTLDLDPFSNQTSAPAYLEVPLNAAAHGSRIVYLSWSHAENLATLSGTCNFVLTTDRPGPLSGSVSLVSLDQTMLDLTSPRAVGSDGLVPLSQGTFETLFN